MARTVHRRVLSDDEIAAEVEAEVRREIEAEDARDAAESHCQRYDEQ